MFKKSQSCSKAHISNHTISAQSDHYPSKSDILHDCQTIKKQNEVKCAYLKGFLPQKNAFFEKQNHTLTFFKAKQEIIKA